MITPPVRHRRYRGSAHAASCLAVGRRSAAFQGDEVLVVGATSEIEQVAGDFGYRFIHCPAGGNFGHVERQYAMPSATGTHLLFLDDDDCYTPGAFAAIRAGIEANPGRPLMFRMIWPGGLLLWVDPVVREGNHGTPQFIVPNDPDRLGRWGSRYQGDFDFCVSTLELYPADALVWNETVIYECRPEHGATSLSVDGSSYRLRARRALRRVSPKPSA